MRSHDRHARALERVLAILKHRQDFRFEEAESNRPHDRIDVFPAIADEDLPGWTRRLQLCARLAPLHPSYDLPPPISGCYLFTEMEDPIEPSALVHARATPPLLDRPQPFMILPSWWFWNDRDNWALIKFPFLGLASITLAVVILLDLPLWAALVVSDVVLWLGLGLFERYIRRLARRRFRSRPAEALSASPTQSPDAGE